MGGKEILETYPKTANFLREWFMNQMIQNIQKDSNGELEDIKKFMQERGIDPPLILMLENNPNGLFETFDNLGVYINIECNLYAGTMHTTYDMKKSKGQHIENNSIWFKSRKETEKSAMLEAIKYIEENFENLVKNES